MKIIIDELNAGIRLDAFLKDVEELDLSRSYAQKLIDNKNILVNDMESKASHKLKSGDQISINIPEAINLDLQAENIPLDIVYEDEDLLLINKAMDMVVHPAPGVNSGTLVNAVLFYCGDKLSSINGVLRPGIVHRLDKDTTGLILVAKNNDAHQALAKQLKERTCSRIYLALCHGHLKEKKQSIRRPIGRHPKERVKMTSFNSLMESKDARDACTHIEVMQEFRFKDRNYSLVKCSLESGRTHQIRVHLSHLKHSIVGDVLYGAADKNPFKANRPILHAQYIKFKHPRSNESMDFKIDLPQDFQDILDCF
ncbi:MAG: RluA family pseudouridine synthase [Candidatus Caenarcaniphilales bacterium]|jgi:23S rRNA pseudouridine1911/1915/1917 synthase|nr:RluA family pseudouridine synthase [Candidatus Caenarcaniphilales bacterium]